MALNLNVYCVSTHSIPQNIFFHVFVVCQVFRGNTNAFVVIRNKIEEPLLALSLRFVVKTWHNDICLRAEIYGCYPGLFLFVMFGNKIDQKFCSLVY